MAKRPTTAERKPRQPRAPKAAPIEQPTVEQPQGTASDSSDSAALQQPPVEQPPVSASAAAEAIASGEGLAAARKVKTVKMRRDPETHPEPHDADVHPDEVDNFRNEGWQEA